MFLLPGISFISFLAMRWSYVATLTGIVILNMLEIYIAFYFWRICDSEHANRVFSKDCFTAVAMSTILAAICSFFY